MGSLWDVYEVFKPIYGIFWGTKNVYQLNTKNIDKYASKTGVDSMTYTKNMITFGSPGTGKSYFWELTVLYSLLLGLNTITTSLMGVCANALWGKHIHKLFLTSTNDNLSSSPFKCAEEALIKTEGILRFHMLF